MRILLIRHADPDYEIDGLTEKGEREAQLLAKRLAREKIDAIYCSTLGRAILTAQPTIDRLDMAAEYYPWLREFSYATVKYPYQSEAGIAWDVLPEFMNEAPELYSTEWYRSPVLANTTVYEEYKKVTESLDALLEKHGYKREGNCYKVTERNHDTIAVFCHFGVIAVLLSHLLNCSPYSIWQNACALPTSVTTLYTEERKAGIASMRMTEFASLSHLYIAGEEPAFSARFCECFTDDTRH